MRSIRFATAPFAAVVLACAACAPAHADMKLEDYRPYENTGALPDSVKSYVDGLGEGYVWANALLATRDEPKIFCTPEFGPPDGDFVSLLNAQIASHAGMTRPYDDDARLAMILLDALINAFPCKP